MPYGHILHFVVGTGVLDCPLVTDYGMLDILCHFRGIIANFLNGSHRCLVHEDGKFALSSLRERGFLAPCSRCDKKDRHRLGVKNHGWLDTLCHLRGIIANFLNGSHRCLVDEDGKFALNSLRLYITGLETVCRKRQTTKYACTYLPLARFTRAGHRPVRCAIKNKDTRLGVFVFYGADYGARTRHLRLGKATLYQMS